MNDLVWCRFRWNHTILARHLACLDHDNLVWTMTIHDIYQLCISMLDFIPQGIIIHSLNSLDILQYPLCSTNFDEFWVYHQNRPGRITLWLLNSLLWKVAPRNRSFMMIYPLKMLIFHNIKLSQGDIHYWLVVWNTIYFSIYWEESS